MHSVPNCNIYAQLSGRVSSDWISLSLWSGQLLSGHLHHAFISCVPICSLFLLRWHMGSDCIGMFVNNYTVGRNFLVGLLAIMVDDQIRSVASLFTGVIQHATLAA